MFHKTAFASLALAVAMLTGCDKPEEAAPEQPTAEAAKDTGNPYQYHDPRERAKLDPNKKTCFVPPCDSANNAAADTTKAGDKPAAEQPAE